MNKGKQKDQQICPELFWMFLTTAKESQLHTTKGAGKYKQEKRTKTLPT